MNMPLAVRSSLRVIWFALKPFGKLIPASVQVFMGVGLFAVPPGFSDWVRADWRWLPIALATALTLLFVAAARLQIEHDTPLRIALVEVSFVENEEFQPFAPGNPGNTGTTPVFGLRGEFVNRGKKAVSVAFSLKKGSLELTGKSYDDLLRLEGFRVLPGSLHNPLFLGAPGEEHGNRKGVIGFVVNADALRLEGIELRDLRTAELTIEDRHTGQTQVIPLSDVATPVE